MELLDLRFKLRPQSNVTDKVVIVEIGDDTIGGLGDWPLDRSYHAILVKALSEAGAKAIVFDIFFNEAREHDEEFAVAIRDAKNVYLPFVFNLEPSGRSKMPHARSYAAKNLENLSIFARGQGHINIFPDIDGKFRRVGLYIIYGNSFYPYVSFLMACDYLGIPQKEINILPGKYVSCGSGLKIPIDDNSNMIINFSGKWGDSYTHYSYIDILQSYIAKASGQKPLLDLGIFKDSICIIGLTATGTVDLHPNPLEGLYPGVGLHAEIFNSLVNKRFIARLSKEANLGILLVLGLLIFLTALKTKPAKGLLALISAVILFVVIGILLFIFCGIWIDLFLPVAVMGAIYLLVTFYKYIAEWRKRLVLENELNIARKIQESFLPKKLPSPESLDISAAMFTAHQVGGDLYDFVEFGSDKIGVMIGDVSGKGIPASLFMAMVTGEFRFFATPNSPAQDVLFNLNARIVRESSSNLFVTVFYMIFDMKNGIARFSNGGHLPAIYLGKDKSKAEFLDVDEGTPLGLMDGPYSSKEISFREGDIFVLYTDGVTEAMNSKGEMYEKEKLARVVESHRNASSKILLNMIERDVRRFENKSKQHDDITIITIKIVGKKQGI